MTTPALNIRLEESFWDELEAEAEATGGYVDRSTGVIEGRFNTQFIFMELIERFQLVAEI
jgi:hypothetical protein